METIKHIRAREWNDGMYRKHATPYSGLAGIVVRQRAKAIRSLADVKHDDSVLEVGCEAGNLLARFPDARRIVGVDISGEALRDAMNLFRRIKRNAEFVQCDATTSLPFVKGEFSVIVCPDVLEHVSEPESILDSVLEISTPSTRIVFSVPNEVPVLRLKRILAKIGLLQKIMPGIEAGLSEWHLQSFTKKSLLGLLSRRLRVETIRIPMGLNIVALCRPIVRRSDPPA